MMTFLIVLLALSLMANWKLGSWYYGLTKRDYRYYIRELQFKLKHLIREVGCAAYSESEKEIQYQGVLENYYLIASASQFALAETIKKMSKMRYHLPGQSSYMDEMNILGYLRLIGLREGQLLPERDIQQTLIPFLPEFQRDFSLIESSINELIHVGILCPEKTLTSYGAKILYQNSNNSGYWQIIKVG